MKNFRVISIIAALICLLWMPAAYAKTVDAQKKPKEINFREVDARIKRLMNNTDMVGMAVAVVEDGEITYAKGFGETRAGTGDKVTEDTVFRWASLSKSVAATALVNLTEDGKIGMQSPIASYAPSLKLPKSKFAVTLEDILSHRSGIKSNAYDKKIEAGQPAKLVRASLEKTDRLCEPGACYTYQNVAFDAVAEMAETVSGLPYKTLVNQMIFEPLDMQTASITLEGLEQSAHWARPHNRAGRTYAAVKPTYYRLPAAAGVNSSVKDLAKWMQAQMQSSPAMSETARQNLHTARMDTPYEDRKMRRHYPVLKNSSYALGWRVYNYEGREVIGHRGAVQGYRSHILFDPELKTGVVVLWNSSHGRPAGLALEVLDQAYGKKRRDWMRLRTL